MNPIAKVWYRIRFVDRIADHFYPEGKLITILWSGLAFAGWIFLVTAASNYFVPRLVSGIILTGRPLRNSLLFDLMLSCVFGLVVGRFAWDRAEERALAERPR